MNQLPRLPERFRQGEIPTAAKYNAMLDWMEALAAVLPSLAVRTAKGGALVHEHTPTGTVISLARGFAKGGGTTVTASASHPFKVSARSETRTVDGVEKMIVIISVASGQIFMPIAPTNDNTANLTLEFLDTEYEVADPTAGENISVTLYIPAREKATESGTYITGDIFYAGIGINNIFEPPEGAGYLWWQFDIADIRRDGTSLTINQRWKSDISGLFFT